MLVKKKKKTNINGLTQVQVARVIHSVMSDSLPSQGLQPTRLLCPWNSSCKDTGLGSHSFLQGIFPIWKSILASLIAGSSEPPRKPNTA